MTPLVELSEQLKHLEGGTVDTHTVYLVFARLVKKKKMDEIKGLFIPKPHTMDLS